MCFKLLNCLLLSKLLKLSKLESETCEVSIYDINGRLMSLFTIKENQVPKTISLEAYSSGIYFYKAISGDKSVQNKLVIIK
ncbi:MAG: T9SS type A sorting domain-containing protein [Bacteroidota bacterium]